MWWRRMIRSVVGAMSTAVILLVVGCAPRAEPAGSVTPTLPAAAASPTSRPVPTATSTLVPVPTSTLAFAATEEVGMVTFTIVYDNNRYDPALLTAWGFACLVETEGATVLFDTGGDSPTLLGNMARLGIDPQAIDAVVLSHIHGDHVGGLPGLLDAGARPTVYVPTAFPTSFKDGVRERTELVEVGRTLEILSGVHTTGEVGSGIVEQALVVEVGDGLVVVTGCAHPGVVEMVRRAREVVGGDVALVMGGFHLGGAGRSRIESIIADFRQLSVHGVAPCHCTGDQARRMFADAFGQDFIPAGVGQVIVVGAGEGVYPEPVGGGSE